jgi:phytoene desaturase
MVSQSTSQVAVIGSGIAGIAASIRLALRGHRVRVFESSSSPGGKLTQFFIGGFRFDRGPSLFTMPQWVDELFILAGENPRDHFNYRKLDPVTNYFFSDGTNVKAWSDRQAFITECQKKLGEAPERIEAYLNDSARKYRITAPFFVEASLHRFSTYFNRKLPAALVALPTLGIFQTMHETHTRQFTNPKTIQLFNRYATYNGSDPYQAPATLTLIPHLEFNEGAYLPFGGMYQIADSLYQLALRLGVEFHFNQRVREIKLNGNRVSGLIVNGNELPVSTVLSNADVFTTYRTLLPNYRAPERILKQPRSSSALIFYWGIKRTFPMLDVHNIVFSEDYLNEFKDIFGGNKVPCDPTIYVNITSKCEQQDAPQGCENWFVMINVPPNTGQNWEELISRARARIIDRLNQQFGIALEALIGCEAVFEPRTIESLTGSWQGSLYGTSSNNRLAAFLRHANRSSRIKGLYFCGGSVHPGGGIPLCLQSGKIAAQLINEDQRNL